MYEVECLSCKKIFMQSKKLNKCPSCGSGEIVNTIKLVLKDGAEQDDFTKGKRKASGKKKPSVEFQNGSQHSFSRKKRIYKERVIDRENNQYYEKVVDPDTGEIIHNCDEPLSDHWGHGSDKK